MPYKNLKQQRNYQRLWMANRRTEWFEENGPCVFCGSWDDLQLDHVNPEEKFTHRIWSYTKEKRDAELAKCRPLCKVCHQNRTNSYRFWRSKKFRAQIAQLVEQGPCKSQVGSPILPLGFS